MGRGRGKGLVFALDDQNDGPEDPEKTAQNIQKMARNPRPDMFWTEHAKEKMAERNLPMTEALYALRHGAIYTARRLSTRQGFFKYRMECLTPDSDVRPVGVVVVPDFENLCLKILTVMWVDGGSTPSGSCR